MKVVDSEGAKSPTPKRTKKNARLVRPSERNSSECDISHSIADALLLDRLDDIHDDIKQLQTDVRGLQDDMLRHRTGAKMIVAIGSALIAVATWLWTQYWQLVKHIGP